MPHQSRPTAPVQLLRKSLITLLALSGMTACDRFKERVLGMGRNSTVAPTPVEFDSLASRRDSIVRRTQAAKDSMAAVGAVRLATDSLSHTARRASASTATASATAAIQAPVMSRAQIMGDSIANAAAERIAGQNRNAGMGDTVRGMVKMDGSGAGSRPILTTNGGKTVITLSGMGTDGLSQVLGSDVVVRGMRVSPRDIVVSGFIVRAVNGMPTVDGRLMRAGSDWVIELSDKSGLHKLSAVPGALQAFEGARVWVAEEGKNAVPQLYGVIARR